MIRAHSPARRDFRETLPAGMSSISFSARSDPSADRTAYPSIIARSNGG
jgi:hypothetical protein